MHTLYIKIIFCTSFSNIISWFCLSFFLSAHFVIFFKETLQMYIREHILHGYIYEFSGVFLRGTNQNRRVKIDNPFPLVNHHQFVGLIVTCVNIDTHHLYLSIYYINKAVENGATMFAFKVRNSHVNWYKTRKIYTVDCDRFIS